MILSEIPESGVRLAEYAEHCGGQTPCRRGRRCPACPDSRDEPVPGRVNGENVNIGLVDASGHSYAKLVTATVRRNAFNTVDGLKRPALIRPKS